MLRNMCMWGHLVIEYIFTTADWWIFLALFYTGKYCFFAQFFVSVKTVRLFNFFLSIKLINTEFIRSEYQSQGQGVIQLLLNEEVNLYTDTGYKVRINYIEIHSPLEQQLELNIVID